MGKQFLIASAVRPFLAIEAIGRTEIRDARGDADASPAEEHHAFALAEDAFDFRE